MSGFAGVISLEGAPPDRDLLRRMADVLEFRGPDATYIVTQPGAGFVFTFLRTGPAPQCPSQPCTLDGRDWLIGDIRLDGRDDLRLKLEQHGEGFDTEPTDEELVLRAWRRWGESVLPDLIGDYAFAIWDSEARRLVCARDLIGARPFFYAQASGWFFFSNTLNAIRCSRVISAELDPHFIGDFLLQGTCTLVERTAFRRISRLPAGHVMQYCADSGVRVGRFGAIPIDEPLFLKRDQDYVERFRVLLERAVLERLPRGPAAIYMSGGIDSTSVAAVAVNSARKNNLPLDLRAYTIDCRPLFEDEEGLFATRTAEYIGIPIEIESAAVCAPFADWEDSLPGTPEPYHEPFRGLHTRQSHKIATHARVALNGMGGDGVLTGQTWPYLVDSVKSGRLRNCIRTCARYALRHHKIPPLRGGFRAALRQRLRPTDPMDGYPRWLAPGFERSIDLRSRWHELQRPFEESHPWHPRGYAILQGLSTMMEADEPPITDAALSSRAPLLDLRIQRFLLQIPPVPLCIDKELLRRALHGSLPEEILTRPKTGLPGDQVLLHMKKNKWSPLPLPKPTDSILEFVAWHDLTTILQRNSISYPWADFNPISLVHWLRAIESRKGIQ